MALDEQKTESLRQAIGVLDAQIACLQSLQIDLGRCHHADSRPVKPIYSLIKRVVKYRDLLARTLEG